MRSSNKTQHWNCKWPSLSHISYIVCYSVRGRAREEVAPAGGLCGSWQLREPSVRVCCTKQRLKLCRQWIPSSRPRTAAPFYKFPTLILYFLLQLFALGACLLRGAECVIRRYQTCLGSQDVCSCTRAVSLAATLRTMGRLPWQKRAWCWIDLIRLVVNFTLFALFTKCVQWTCPVNVCGVLFHNRQNLEGFHEVFFVYRVIQCFSFYSTFAFKFLFPSNMM
jgi:hypothetical protein